MHQTMRVCSVVALLAITAGGVALPQSLNSVLQPQDLLAMVQLATSPSTPTTISPDGKHIAYVIADAATAPESTSFDPRGNGKKELWVVDVATAAAHRIGDPSADDWAPVWSPNSEQLAFYAGHSAVGRVAIWNATTGVVQTTSLFVGTNGQVVQWLADSRRLIVPVLTAQSLRDASKETSGGFPKPTPTPAISVFSATPPPASIGVASGNIVTGAADTGFPTINETLYGVGTGLSRTLIPNVRLWAVPQISPDGRSLMYLIDKGEIDGDINDREIFDVAVVDLQSGQSQIVAKDTLSSYYGGTYTWSRDSTRIAYIGGVIPSDQDVTTKDSGGSFPGHCYLIDLRNPGHVQMLGSGLFSRFGGHVFWSADSSTIYAVDDPMRVISAISAGSGLTHPVLTLADATFAGATDMLRTAGTHLYTLAISDTGERRIYDVDLTSGTLQLIFHAYQDLNSLTLSADGTQAAYNGQDPRRPPDVWVAQNGFTSTRQLTHLNPQIESRALGDAESVSWKSRSGVPLDGVLLLPAGYQAGKRYPTVTWIYGGESEGTDDRTAFGIAFGGTTQAPYFNLQLLASRGYAVFVPNSVLHVGTPMSDLADDVLPGIDQIVAMGIADPDRLGVYGQSYGGYSTMALVVQSDRFKAAVATSGIYDIFAMYGTMYEDGSDWTSWSESEQGRMGGTPWNQQQRYIDNSPFFFFDKVHTPVLFEYGATDKFSAINAEEAFVSLRRLGQTVELARYADEGHVLMKRSNQIDFCNRMLDWFHKYLQS